MKHLTTILLVRLTRRWRSLSYEELSKRDKLNLDIFWLKDESLEDSENLPEPEALEKEIADDLEAALEHFRTITIDPGNEIGGDETLMLNMRSSS